jgi:hypothetical protein
MKIDLLNTALGHIEKQYASLRAFRDLCGEIVDFQEEAKRARLEATAAQKSLTDLQAQVTGAQTQLDKLQGNVLRPRSKSRRWPPNTRNSRKPSPQSKTC